MKTGQSKIGDSRIMVWVQVRQFIHALKSSARFVKLTLINRLMLEFHIGKDVGFVLKNVNMDLWLEKRMNKEGDGRVQMLL